MSSEIQGLDRLHQRLLTVLESLDKVNFLRICKNLRL